jgi:chorismate mutase
MTAVRALRGAIQVARDDPGVIAADTILLLRQLLERNQLSIEDFISVVFTMTPDLTSGFPAAAARSIGFADVPMLCAVEVAVPGALPRVVRLLAHVQLDRPGSRPSHVYLRGAAALRPDLAA